MAKITRRSAQSKPGAPRQPAVPLPRHIQALVHQRHQEKMAASITRRGQSVEGGMAGPQLAVIRNLPKVYSPLYEMSNLMLPRDMKTMNSWCLTGDTLVLTECFEWEPIGGLTAGNRVITHTGQIAPIKETTHREVDEEIIEIFVKGSEESINITGNHELYVLRSEGGDKTEADSVLSDVRAEDIVVGDCLVYPINQGVMKKMKQQESGTFSHGYLLTPVTKICKKPFKGKVYDMEVDHEDHSYVTSVGAVHNSRHFFACLDEQTQTLTDNGFKYYWEIDPEKDKIACFNPETEELEFQFGELFTYDYDSDVHGPLIHFQTKKIDIKVTAEHNMWAAKTSWKDERKDEWSKVKAKDIKRQQYRFRSAVKWGGEDPESGYIEVADELIHIEDYLRYLGLFLSEGWIEFSAASTPAPAKVGISQCEYRKSVRQSKFDEVATIVEKVPFEATATKDYNHQEVQGKSSFVIYGKEFASHFLKYGRYSQDRFIPQWIKGLKTEYLEILLESMILGDGTVSYSDSYARIGTNHLRQVVYTTSSQRLADDVYEVAYKCGYVPTLFFQEKEGSHKDLYLVKINDSTKGHFPILKSQAKTLKGKEKQEVSYKGKVYCFHVPPHNLFVVRRNGKVTITGNTNPIVRNAITLHATYPISKFNITCEDPKVKQFFEDMFENMNFRALLMGIAMEFWKLGEAMPYLELDEDQGVWDYGFLHNPDFIRVKTDTLARYPVIYLIPDDGLRRVVQGRSQGDARLRAQLPADVLYHVMRGEDIPLSNFNCSHLKMLNSEYDIRGTSLITACYKDLMLYDKIREMQFSQADGMINPVTLVKLGDPQGNWRPNDEDVAAFQAIMEEAQYDPDFKIITHGAVNIERIGYSGHTLEVSGMWDAINKNLYTGLLAPESILNGEGTSYATATVGLEVLRTRYDRFREQIAEWVEKKVMEPICKLQDFYTNKGGTRKLIVPKVMWNKLNLRDMDGYIATLTGLLAQPAIEGQPGVPGKVSDLTLYESLDLDYDEELKRMRQEAIDRAVQAKESVALGKKSLEELLTLDPDKPIVDTHKDEDFPITNEQEGPAPGGLPGGGGGPMGAPPMGGGGPPLPEGMEGPGLPGAPAGPGPELGSPGGEGGPPSV